MINVDSYASSRTLHRRIIVLYFCHSLVVGRKKNKRIEEEEVMLNIRRHHHHSASSLRIRISGLYLVYIQHVPRTNLNMSVDTSAISLVVEDMKTYS